MATIRSSTYVWDVSWNLPRDGEPLDGDTHNSCFSDSASPKNYGTLRARMQGRKPASYWINKPRANLPRRAGECEISYSHTLISSEAPHIHSKENFYRLHLERYGHCSWCRWVRTPLAPFRKEARRERPIMNSNREVGNSLMPGVLARYRYFLLWRTKGKIQVTIHPFRL